MLVLFTLLVMILVAYAGLRNGLLNALAMVVNIVIAGLVAFNFYEPLANELEMNTIRSFLEGTDDALALTLLFGITLAVLRVTVENLVPSELDLPALAQQISTGLVGLFAGYLLAGFLVCVWQTLPIEEKFLGFDHTVTAEAGPARRFLPPDRVWLSMMNYAGQGPLAQSNSTYFDPEGSFSLRYARRRVKE
jgi:uncharacterized membrane protein required for colicin V production